MALALLLIYGVLVSVQTADCYVVHSVYHCLFNSTELEDIQYISSFIYNKVEFLRFDSNIGNYVGYTPFGLKQADNLNNNPVTLSRMRAEEVQCCQHISELLYRNILNKSVKPSVSLKSVPPRSGGQSGLLICSVYDFYPKRIKVTWLKDGQEVTSDVTSTEELPDGTWLYQIHSSLEYTPRSGEKISCRVEHASLKQPLMTDWDPSMPESERNKIAIGASGLILGLVLSLAGFIYYKRKSRDLLPIPTFNQDPDT